MIIVWVSFRHFVLPSIFFLYFRFRCVILLWKRVALSRRAALQFALSATPAPGSHLSSSAYAPPSSAGRRLAPTRAVAVTTVLPLTRQLSDSTRSGYGHERIHHSLVSKCSKKDAECHVLLRMCWICTHTHTRTHARTRTCTTWWNLQNPLRGTH